MLRKDKEGSSASNAGGGLDGRNCVPTGTYPRTIKRLIVISIVRGEKEEGNIHFRLTTCRSQAAIFLYKCGLMESQDVANLLRKRLDY
jgi:hypothetical protein